MLIFNASLILSHEHFVVIFNTFPSHWWYALQGFNGTLTVPVERKGDQYQETELTMHPELKQPLAELCSDPKTTVVVLSGSGRPVLDQVILLTLPSSLWTTWSNVNLSLLQNFKEYDIWLAAENGMFLNPSKGEWMTTMPEQLNMEWVDSVKVLIWSFNCFLLSFSFTILTYIDDPLLSACFWVLHR